MWRLFCPPFLVHTHIATYGLSSSAWVKLYLPILFTTLVTVCLTGPTSVTTICSSSLARIPLKEYTGGIRNRFALSLLFIHGVSSTNSVALLLVRLAFTTANCVHLCTADYIVSLSDTDIISEHLPTADIANRESILMWEGATQQSHTYSLASARVHSKQTSLSIYKLANARRPVYLLTFLVA